MLFSYSCEMVVMMTGSRLAPSTAIFVSRSIVMVIENGLTLNISALNLMKHYRRLGVEDALLEYSRCLTLNPSTPFDLSPSVGKNHSKGYSLMCMRCSTRVGVIVTQGMFLLPLRAPPFSASNKVRDWTSNEENMTYQTLVATSRGSV